MPKKNGIKLIKDYIIPSLDNKRFNDKMRWIDEDIGIFGLEWVHKSNSRYSEADSVVYQEWSQLKKLWNPTDPKAISKAKQRFRAALRKQKNLEKIDHQKNYRKYQIKNIKEIRQQLKERRKSSAYDDDEYRISEYLQLNYIGSSESETYSVKNEYSDESLLFYEDDVKNIHLHTDNSNYFYEFFLNDITSFKYNDQEDLHFEEIKDSVK